MQLYNTLSAKERAALLEEAGEERLTLSFYQYAKIGNPELFRNHLFIAWNEMEVLGRIYVAHEGINAQLSVPAKRFEEFKAFLDGIYFLEGCRLNIAVEQDLKSFLKLKVKVRHKIVADGLNDETFDVTNKGVHVDAKTFNELLEDPNAVVVDMRNHYESEIGHFKGAVTPDVDTFRDSLDIIEEDLKKYAEVYYNKKNQYINSLQLFSHLNYLKLFLIFWMMILSKKYQLIKLKVNHPLLINTKIKK